MSRLIREAGDWLWWIAASLPGSVGLRARRLALKPRLRRLGPGAAFGPGVTVTAPERISIGEGFSMMQGSFLYAHSGGDIEIGDHVSLNANVCLGAADGGSIKLGDNVLIAQNVVLRASDHVFAAADKPIRRQGHTGGRIVVEDDVWIGANAVVVAGVTIGAHAVVGAGAVVTRDVEPWTVVGGVPAKVIRRRQAA